MQSEIEREKAANRKARESLQEAVPPRAKGVFPIIGASARALPRMTSRAGETRVIERETRLVVEKQTPNAGEWEEVLFSRLLAYARIERRRGG